MATHLLGCCSDMHTDKSNCRKPASATKKMQTHAIHHSYRYKLVMTKRHTLHLTNTKHSHNKMSLWIYMYATEMYRNHTSSYYMHKQRKEEAGVNSPHFNAQKLDISAIMNEINFGK